MQRRSGYKFVCEADEETKLIPFQFSSEQTYVIAVSPNFPPRIIKDGKVREITIGDKE